MVSNMSYNIGLKQNQALGFIPRSKTLEKWVNKPDSFQYTNGIPSFEDREITRLFPNGELNKIYNGIANDYGIETPPSLELIKDFELGDRGYFTPTSNKIKLVLDFLKPEARKFLLEKDNQKFYIVGDSRGLLFRVKENDIKKEQQSLEQMGFKVTPEPLSDDDKKKYAVFILAHELSHAYQNQIIRQTEGLNEWNMIEQKLNNNKPEGINLIRQKLEMIKAKQIYDKTHAGMNFEKKYPLSSKEGQQAKIWYDANVGYKRPETDYEENITNPLEIYANNKAYKYLKNKYGYFEGAIDF